MDTGRKHRRLPTYLLLAALAASSCTGDIYDGCEPLVQSAYCKDAPKQSFRAFSPYTQLPNILGHETQGEAAMQVTLMAEGMMHMGIEVPYDLNFRRFVCTIFLPPCLSDGSTPPPCQELCDLASKAAEPAKNTEHLYWWPEEYSCDTFPSLTNRLVTCIPPYNTAPGGQVGEAGPYPGAEAGDGQGEEAARRPGGGEETGTAVRPGAGEGRARAHYDPRCVDMTRGFTLDKCTVTCRP